MSIIPPNDTEGFSEDFDVSSIEAEDQKFLRYEFSTITAENGTDIDCFDPSMLGQKEAFWLRLRTDRKDLEEADPVVSEALLYGMLHRLGIELPTDSDDERNIFFHTYRSGVRKGTSCIIWNVTREDGVAIPFYTFTKKKNPTRPKFIGILTYEKSETARQFFQADIDADMLLNQQLKISKRVLQRFGFEEKQAILATYKDIQNL